MSRSPYSQKLLRRIGETWGEWEDKSDTVDHPLAPPNLIMAWCNNRFAVQKFYRDGFTWLSIRKHVEGAKEPSWSELQRIKNELVGPERQAVQVYPRHSDLVDQADMYHLWLYDEDDDCPFNFTRVGWKTSRA